MAALPCCPVCIAQPQMHRSLSIGPQILVCQYAPICPCSVRSNKLLAAESSAAAAEERNKSIRSDLMRQQSAGVTCAAPSRPRTARVVNHPLRRGQSCGATQMKRGSCPPFAGTRAIALSRIATASPDNVECGCHSTSTCEDCSRCERAETASKSLPAQETRAFAKVLSSLCQHTNDGFEQDRDGLAV